MVDRPERRTHQRLAIGLPLECSAVGAAQKTAYRTVAINVSTSGLYFEADSSEFRLGALLNLELTVPPGDGYFPYPGRVRGVGEVVRVGELADDGPEVGRRRFGIATRFRTPLKLVFEPER